MGARAYLSSRSLLAAGFLMLLGLGFGGVRTASARACVWKVTSGGQTLYLAGSVHTFRQSDYPLPPEYDQAYSASASLAFETDLTGRPTQILEGLTQAGQLPKGVTLKDRVDPRTYAYLQRVLSHVHGATDPEKKIEHLRPWAIALLLRSSKGDPFAAGSRPGVEGYLISRANRDHKKMAGLVRFKDHIAVFGGMSDTDSEIYLLHTFIHLDTGSTRYSDAVTAWKRGDSDALDHMDQEDYRDAPTIRQRLIIDRNNTWLPKVEGYLHSGTTWMVVAGALHMSGGNGLPALLRARGYQVEQF